MYDPTVGRWLSKDPIEFEGGDADLYRYVGNGPTDATDPSGLQIQPFPPGAPNWDYLRPRPPLPPPWIGPLKANPAARPDFDQLLNFIKTFPFGGVTWTDPCYNWAAGVWGKMPLKFIGGGSPIKVQPVCFNVSGNPLASAHTAFEVTFPDGSVVFFDEGSFYSTIAGALGGPDRFFGPDEIPNNYTPVPCKLQGH